MRKCDFNKVASQLKVGRSPVNLLHIFRTPFFRNTSRWLLLPVLVFEKKADQEILFTKFLIIHGLTIQTIKLCTNCLDLPVFASLRNKMCQTL